MTTSPQTGPQTDPQTSNDTDTISSLTAEVERLKKHLHEYNISVERKLDEVEQGMLALEAENRRLIDARESAYVELDACVSLIARFAASQGLGVGTKEGTQVIVDLPAGQVTWEFGVMEAHLFTDLPEYLNPIESLTIQEKYGRVMNPGILPLPASVTES